MDITLKISIHALLAESDAAFVAINPFALLFLSTLSLRRATAGGIKMDITLKISIHALLAESDLN